MWKCFRSWKSKAPTLVPSAEYTFYIYEYFISSDNFMWLFFAWPEGLNVGYDNFCLMCGCLGENWLCFSFTNMHTFWHQMCGISPTLTNSSMPAGILQSNFDSNHNANPTGCKFCPTRLCPYFRHQTQAGVVRWPTTSVQLGNKLESPTIPSSSLIIC